ncbi:MAG: glycosyltransferase family 4 protein [Endomicrobia bacterium]|nr:glycosyltransferase family 4 protein [Endomicrobiia bacterium]MDW8055795.1 glycosyltransferase family 4 protein [Elusimicrobiota bacterium]
MIAVIGWRNFLLSKDAISEHCSEVYRRLVDKGWKFIIFVKHSVPQSQYKGIKLVYIPTLKIKFLETPIYAILSLLWLITHKSAKSGLVHIHTIGCSFILPFLKFLGYKVVVTHHGPDYVRTKWNFIEKQILKLCEKIVVMYADEIFCIAVWIKYFIEQNYNKPVTCTPNGIGIKLRKLTRNYIKQFALSPGNYFLCVGGFVPEKGFLDVVRAFNGIEDKEGWKLVLAGTGIVHQKYLKQIRYESKPNPDIIIIPETLPEMMEELFSNAGVFVTTSHYEAAPTYLITAIGYNLPVIASSIDANIMVGKEYAYYYPQGHIFGLRYYLKKAIRKELQFRTFNRDLVLDYDWNKVTSIVEDVYLRLLSLK